MFPPKPLFAKSRTVLFSVSQSQDADKCMDWLGAHDPCRVKLDVIGNVMKHLMTYNHPESKYINMFPYPTK